MLTLATVAVVVAGFALVTWRFFCWLSVEAEAEAYQDGYEDAFEDFIQEANSVNKGGDDSDHNVGYTNDF